MEAIASIPVPTETSAPHGRTNAYVVGTDPAILVDPAGRTDALDGQLADRRLEHLLVTHTHPDHVGGVADYAHGATVWAHVDHRQRFVDRTGVDPDRTFQDGTTIPGDPDVDVLATPGHAPDHVALAVECPPGGSAADTSNDRQRVALVGDLAVAEGSVVVGGPDADMAAYLDSLRSIREAGYERLYPGHGPPIDDPAATIDRLIDHRTDRERRVLAAVEGGARTPEEITDAAYDKEIADVYELARATVVAHLEKLAADGAVEFDGERARPR